MLAETVDDHYNSIRYSVKKYLLHLTINFIHRYGMLYRLEQISDELFNGHIKQANGKTLQSRLPATMQAVNEMKQNYERLLPCETEAID